VNPNCPKEGDAMEPFHPRYFSLSLFCPSSVVNSKDLMEEAALSLVFAELEPLCLEDRDMLQEAVRGLAVEWATDACEANPIDPLPSLLDTLPVIAQMYLPTLRRHPPQRRKLVIILEIQKRRLSRLASQSYDLERVLLSSQANTESARVAEQRASQLTATATELENDLKHLSNSEVSSEADSLLKDLRQIINGHFYVFGMTHLSL